MRITEIVSDRLSEQSVGESTPSPDTSKQVRQLQQLQSKKAEATRRASVERDRLNDRIRDKQKAIQSASKPTSP